MYSASQFDDVSLIQALRFLFGRLSRRRQRVLLPVLALMLLGALAEVATIGALVPFLVVVANNQQAEGLAFLAPLADFVGVSRPDQMVVLLIALFALVALIAAALRLVLLWTSANFVNGMAHDLATQIYSETLYEPYSFHIDRNSSEIIAIVNKVQMLSWQVLQPLMTGAIALTISFFITVGLMIVDFWIALLSGTSFVAIYAFVSLFTRGRLKRNSVTIARAQEERIKAMQEGLGGIRDVLLDQSQAVFVGVYDRAEARYRAASVRNTFVAGAPRFLVEAGGMIMIAVVAVLATNRPGGLLEAVPVLGALALGAQRLLPLMQQLYAAWASVMGNRQIVMDIVTLLQRPARETGVRPALPFLRSIRLSKVGFSYRAGLPLVLQGVDLEIEKGARIGITGKTGSGKSTLVDVILGLLEPTEGAISIDGLPLSGTRRLAWQRNVAHVPQVIFLVDASVAQNIAFGVPPHLIDIDRVCDAVKRAELSDVIAALPQGLDTRIGERGIQLSGGQRQRIGIARALYKQASTLVLDEATSALDDDTEAMVMASIGRLDRSLTIIIIAHRLSTLAGCDIVLRVQDGDVEQRQHSPETASGLGMSEIKT